MRIVCALSCAHRPACNPTPLPIFGAVIFLSHLPASLRTSTQLLFRITLWRTPLCFCSSSLFDICVSSHFAAADHHAIIDLSPPRLLAGRERVDDSELTSVRRDGQVEYFISPSSAQRASRVSIGCQVSGQEKDAKLLWYVDSPSERKPLHMKTKQKSCKSGSSCLKRRLFQQLRTPSAQYTCRVVASSGRVLNESSVTVRVGGKSLTARMRAEL